MPQTRSQCAGEEHSSEQQADMVEQQQQSGDSKAETTDVKYEEIFAMLYDQQEIMKTQHLMQRKHNEEMDEWQRSQASVVDNIRNEFGTEIKKINLKFAQLENRVDRKIELIHSEVLDYYKTKEEQCLETYTSLLASTLEDLKREM